MPDDNQNDEDSYTGFFAHFIEEWSQMRPGYNWRTFHVVQIEFEDDRILGAVECTFILLGLGFRARWNYKVTEDVEELHRRLEEVLDGTDNIEVSRPSHRV